MTIRLSDTQPEESKRTTGIILFVKKGQDRQRGLKRKMENEKKNKALCCKPSNIDKSETRFPDKS